MVMIAIRTSHVHNVRASLTLPTWSRVKVLSSLAMATTRKQETSVAKTLLLLVEN